MSEPPHDASLYACIYQPPVPGRFVVGRQESFDRTDPTRSAGSDPSSSGLSKTSASASPSTVPLVALAAEFSPRYEQHRPDLVSIDLRGLSRLFGTPRTIGEELRRESAARGMRVHVAIAPTRMAALVLSLARPGLTVIGPGDVSAALAPLPLSVLEQLHEDASPPGSAAQQRLTEDQTRAAIAVLKRWGVRTLGELASLPAADLSARLGRGGRLWQAVARGDDVRPLVPMQAAERFEGTLELEWPIEGSEPLSFVLTRLLEPLSTRLERRDRGAAVLHVELGLVTRDVHACRLELPSPLRDVRALRTLVLLDVGAHPPSAAIDRVTVTIEPTPGRILQHALFARPHPTPEQLSTLLARLGALMGQDRIGAPALVDSCRPGAFAMTAFAIEHHVPASCPPPPVPERELPISVLRRCRQPIPARVVMDDGHRPQRVSSDRRGFAGGAVLSCAGPWRTSGAWWEEELVRTAGAGLDSGRRGPWSRDEWDVALGDGAVYRIFRDRTTDGWFIDGVMD